MQVISVAEVGAAPEPSPASPAAGSVATIGAYDGVHRGHRELIARVRSTADSMGAASVVVTFDRHPATVVRPASAPRLLTDLDQKLELLASTGVDVTAVVHFDEERAAEDPEHFVRSVLVDGLRTRSVVVGHDFHFGRGRRGNVELLQRLGGELGFDVTGLRLVRDGDEPVSSTRIRALVAEGRVEEAAELLGRDHQIRGTVEHGDGRGRVLGFATANVAVPAGIAVPADGVYAGWYGGPDGERRPSCISVGRRPTFFAADAPSLVEVHLLDFDGDLYGQPAMVDFTARQRGQQRFDSPPELVAQMERDVQGARRLLGVGAAG
ncbi:MAG TPA: bifunctional riboflavin kinase/FAD synthetase [Acidimicrobiales bacterium]|nr:bifunctional riboflavin kinase/FAD synthetase [Acidimicrobiales bacterium]